ncbi:Immunogenic protein p35 (plasmid) [Borrelia miyamotoi FR64b]|uniref:Immunogenic protein p35 n=1 Tax=Borrelia miyamotoi FR64b TaxID=1292392 RepID=W5SG29_9SPIR|nr:hypothetical protein [Borrelia miyamotoi]AHH06059.1 Immunogenic protein p35 [Borrelia miyamotoi FR64b]ATQ20208.1 hypothetical protein CNO10_05260 [Borrelia miyamotoi]ATQ20406.1 hypothetical protein CNO10_06405 [Borrelia miyamotoi]WAZ71356.1 hypothetical protein O5403_06825 [Borrelia miyamotoi]
MPAHKDITIITTDTSQNKSYSNSNNIIDNASITTSNTDQNIVTQKTAINTPAKTVLTHTIEHNISTLDDNTTYSSQNNNPSYQQNSDTVEHQANTNIQINSIFTYSK